MSAAPPPRAGAATGLAALALVVNAFVWGTSWWPFRWLQAQGLHPLWATALIYVVAAAVIVAARPGSVRLLLGTPALWVIVIASGTTNAAFNWAVVIGDVVRVVLLFYLMPVWAALLARLLLGERFSAAAIARTALALVGAAIVLWPDAKEGQPALSLLEQFPLPRSLPDWLGVVGGFSFALNNVMLRREAARPEEGRALAMFIGGAGVAGVLAALLASQGQVAWPPAAAPGWLLPALALAFGFLLANLALQYGAARLPANRTSVVMLTEVVFASASAVALGGGTLTGKVALGGGLIVASAVLAALAPADAH